MHGYALNPCNPKFTDVSTYFKFVITKPSKGAFQNESKMLIVRARPNNVMNVGDLHGDKNYFSICPIHLKCILTCTY